MLCRCRYLRAYHVESLLSTALPSISTRCTSRTASTSQRFSRAFSGSPSSHHGKTDKHGHASDINSLAGSIHSPLAFKPFPSAVHDAFLDEELNLESESDEEEQSLSVTVHSEDPLPRRSCTASLKSPDATENTEDVEEPNSTNSEVSNADELLPWDTYVRQLKMEKFLRQTAKAMPFLDPVYAIQQWDHIRTWDRHQIANLSVFRWALLARAGCQLSEPSVLYNLPAELVDSYVNSPKAQSSMVARVLRKLVPIDERAFANHPIFDPLLRPWDRQPFSVSDAEAAFHKNLDQLSMDLFSEYYQDKPTLVARFPRDMIFRLVAVATCRCPQALNHGGLLNAFFVAARRDGPKLSLAFPSHDPASFDSVPTGHVWALFRLVQVYINSESQREAFLLFQRLVQEKMITPSAISQANISQGDPRTVVLSAMTKTCLDYEWNTGALELMILAADHDPTVFDEQMRTLVDQTLYALLKQAALMSPAQKYNVRMLAAVQKMSTQQVPTGPRRLLRRIMTLIMALRRNHQPFEIEDRIIQQFYAMARQLELHQVAETLFGIGRIYAHSSTSTPPMLVTPSFEISDGPPYERVLPVEPRHIAFKSAPGSTSPSHEVQSTAVSEAATVNTTYPVPHGPVLLWFLETMLKKSKNVHLCRSLAKEVVDSNIDIPVYDRGQFIRLVANAGFAQAGRKLWERYSEDETQGVIGHAGAMTRLVSLFYHLGKDLEAKEAIVDESPDIFRYSSSDAEFPDGGGGDDVEMAVIDGEDAGVLFDASAARDFAKEVVDKFRACKVPLERASQQDLNALARAYFMMDRTEEGFALFQMVKGIRPPDMYDVNVVLSGVARYNVGLASRMIDRMHERGLAPNVVTWGTLIHLAFLKGATELMINLVKRAQERGISGFTARTIGTLIRASVSDVPSGSQIARHTITLGNAKGVGLLELTFGGEGDIEQIRRNLKVAWHLIGTLDSQVFVGTWSLAKFCLDRALWVGDAELAFGFWEKYLGSKTQWNDPGQAESRKKLCELVTMARQENNLEVLQATNMLRRLSTAERGPRLLLG